MTEDREVDAATEARQLLALGRTAQAQWLASRAIETEPHPRLAYSLVTAMARQSIEQGDPVDLAAEELLEEFWPRDAEEETEAQLAWFELAIAKAATGQRIGSLVSPLAVVRKRAATARLRADIHRQASIHLDDRFVYLAGHLEATLTYWPIGPGLWLLVATIAGALIAGVAPTALLVAGVTVAWAREGRRTNQVVHFMGRLQRDLPDLTAVRDRHDLLARHRPALLRLPSLPDRSEVLSQRFVRWDQLRADGELAAIGMLGTLAVAWALSRTDGFVSIALAQLLIGALVASAVRAAFLGGWRAARSRLPRNLPDRWADWYLLGAVAVVGLGLLLAATITRTDTVDWMLVGYAGRLVLSLAALGARGLMATGARYVGASTSASLRLRSPGRRSGR